ncbi:MAG: caspase family protein [Bradyrhizobium sp.]|uniref:caspase family protein n=1 Tax=Bradyrhizobium sp. TaxID=376 RepID=UPI0027157988|nr:caspase family protein [Bradyrhizobium sp.]MDO8401496.1 caspase family protein [Bradyrhizobium sp.]
MSLFKGTLLGAALVASLLAAGWMRSAQAQTAPATEKPAAVGTPLALSGPERRIALVIGNSKYQNTVQLPNPGNDTRAVAQLLNSAGFEVISATDLSHNQMIQAVQEFSGKIAGRGPNTVAMVYYAGHGVQLAGENYLVPVDAKVSSEPDLVNGSLRLVDVMATLETIPSRVRIVILDACRNNPFPSLNDAGRGLAIVDAPKGSIVAYSTAPGTEALDGTGDHSPFTAAFLRLANEKNLPIEQLFKRIRLDVGNSTDGQQTPWESSSLTSDFYFFGDTAVAATRAPAQMKLAYAAGDLPSRSPRQAYEYVLAENSVENYQEFIRLYPHDPMADRIRILLGNLLQAKAWHIAVQANSAVAYKSFYEKFSNSPYAQSALKMAAQPKIIPLSQPIRILAAPSVKTGGLGIAKDHFGSRPGAQGLPQGGGQIVTLPSPGAKPASEHAAANTGKIVSLPVSKAGRIGERPVLKLDGKPTQVEKRTPKSAPLVGIHRGPAATTSAGDKQRFATSSQFRPSPGQVRTGGLKMMR